MSDFKLDLRVDKLNLRGISSRIGATDCYLEARNLNECLADDKVKGQKEAQISHILDESVEYAQFKAIFKQATHVSDVWTKISARWVKSTLASKLLVCEQLFNLQKI
jgi:hypothetical protein